MGRLGLAVTVALFFGLTNVSWGQYLSDWLPPTKYDHEFNGDLIVEQYSQSMVYRKCMQMFEQTGQANLYARYNRFSVMGCSQRLSPTVCRIVMIKDLSFLYDATPEGVFRHERAHCNGWLHE